MTESNASPPRADELEQRLGDPGDPDNPFGFAAILAADERGETPAAAEAELDDYCLNAEFVPPEFGGRLARLDHLVEVMRSVFRRDPSLWLGYGFSSFIASVNIWTSANDDQRRRAADLLLGNGRIAAAYHELAHGNDLTAVEFSAVPGAGSLLLNGVKEVITNIERAQAMVLFVRTDSKQGGRSHSQVFIEKSALPPDRTRNLPRVATVGMRGVRLGGIQFSDCPVPIDSVLGSVGQGLETALKSFQITRTTLAGIATGVLDSGIRAAVGYALSRELYGGPIIDLPHVRSQLVGAFADLLMCDGFSTVAARALHLLPAETSVYASAVKYLVSEVLMDAMDRLSAVLGSRSYLREGETAIFQKLLRDSQLAGFAHISRAACQVSLLPQLPLLARRAWRSAVAAPAALFRLDADLPAVPFGQLAISARGKDRLSASLAAVLDGMAVDTDPELRRHVEYFAAELRTLADECARLTPAEQAVTASPAAYDLTHRYSVILAAGCCVHIWHHNQDRHDPFLRDPAWLIAVLHRLRARLATRSAALPEHIERSLLTELLERHGNAHAFGLNKRQFQGKS